MRNAKLKGDTYVSDRPDCYWFPSRNQFLVGFSKLCFCNFHGTSREGTKEPGSGKESLEFGNDFSGKVNVFQSPFHFPFSYQPTQGAGDILNFLCTVWHKQL